MSATEKKGVKAGEKSQREGANGKERKGLSRKDRRQEAGTFVGPVRCGLPF